MRASNSVSARSRRRHRGTRKKCSSGCSILQVPVRRLSPGQELGRTGCKPAGDISGPTPPLAGLLDACTGASQPCFTTLGASAAIRSNHGEGRLAEPGALRNVQTNRLREGPAKPGASLHRLQKKPRKGRGFFLPPPGLPTLATSQQRLAHPSFNRAAW